jgi:hypothetical protein
VTSDVGRAETQQALDDRGLVWIAMKRMGAIRYERILVTPTGFEPVLPA